MTPGDIYRSATGRERSPQEVAAMRRVYNDQLRNAQFERLHAGPRSAAGPPSSDSSVDRERRQLIRHLRHLDGAESAEYGQFVKQSNAGFATLLAGDNCAQTARDEKISSIAAGCPNNTLPGKGAYFSFRKNDYVSAGMADLGCKEGWFFSVGWVTQSIFVDLGDLPIGGVDLNSGKLRYLVDFVPAATLEAADKQKVELESGVSADDNVYYNAVKAIPSHTYALRSIAYDGHLYNVIDLGGKELKFDMLGSDKRADSIILFRCIGQDQFGNLKIVWRVLKSIRSPKLDLPEQKVDPSKIRVVTVID